MEEKIIYYGMLLEVYGKLLTEKQYLAINKYYNMDLSLAEIAEEENISRQAVRDNIKKAEEKLDNFEKNLKLYQKLKKEDSTLDKLDQNVIKLEQMLNMLPLEEIHLSQKEKIDNTLKEIIKNVDSLKKI